MFTGIIESTGMIIRIVPSESSARLSIEGGGMVSGCKVGDSIAVNGVCLTMTCLNGTSFDVVVVEETIRRTTLGQLAENDRVNLELPLRLTDRLGGHFVEGHIDGRATVAGIDPEGQGVVVTFRASNSLVKYVVEKGSIAIDGVSLTVVDCGDESFRVALIPHTRERTTLGELSVGHDVNVELDILAKYVERLTRRKSDSSRISEEWLRDLGYLETDP